MKLTKEKLWRNYKTSNLIQLNLAEKQNVSYRSIASIGGEVGETEAPNYHFYAMPAFASVRVQLTTPKGDNSGWKSGIRLLWQQLYTANAGKINFSQTDLEKYVQNVRALCAVNSYIKKSYEWTYTFRSTNDDFPYAALESMGLDPTDFIANAADLLMYSQRFAQEIRQNFPLNIPYLHYTEYLFETNFADSDGQKPSIYITAIQGATRDDNIPHNGIQYYVTNFGNTSNRNETSILGHTWQLYFTWFDPFNVGYTYDEFKQQCDTIKDALIEDPTMAAIAQAVIKAFGNKAFFDYKYPEIKSSAKIVYDKDFLSRIQNAMVLSFRNATGYFVLPDDDTYGGDSQLDYSETNNRTSPLVTYQPGEWIDSYCDLSLYTKQSEAGAAQGMDANVVACIQKKYNNVLVNWYADTIKPEDIMNITRWMPTQATYNDAAEGSPKTLKFEMYNTEVITDVFATYRRAAATDSEDGITSTQTRLIQKPIAGNIKTSWIIAGASGTAQLTWPAREAGDIAFLWANFDWAPRYRMLDGDSSVPSGGTADVGETDSVSADVLDWDTYGSVNPEALSQYSSYANQSMLYAGASQNQSNRKVYGNQNGKPMPQRGSHQERPEVIPEDKK